MRLSNLLDVDWDGFGQTRGALVGGIYDFLGFGPFVPPDLSTPAVTAYGGSCVPWTPVRWERWAEFKPQLPALMIELCPVVRVDRGPVKFIRPPEVRP